jgi:hypothetical protein
MTSQVWTHVHMLKVRARAPQRGRKMPNVPCTHHRGRASL